MRSEKEGDHSNLTTIFWKFLFHEMILTVKGRASACGSCCIRSHDRCCDVAVPLSGRILKSRNGWRGWELVLSSCSGLRVVSGMSHGWRSLKPPSESACGADLNPLETD